MYKELSKEEQKVIREKYKVTKKGEELIPRLNRLMIEGIFLIVCCFVIVGAILIFKLPWWYWCVAILTVICGPVFLVGQHMIRVGEYDKFITSLPKTSSKSKKIKK